MSGVAVASSPAWTPCRALSTDIAAPLRSRISGNPSWPSSCKQCSQLSSNSDIRSSNTACGFSLAKIAETQEVQSQRLFSQVKQERARLEARKSSLMEVTFADNATATGHTPRRVRENPLPLYPNANSASTFSSAKRKLRSQAEVMPVATKRAEIIRNLSKAVLKRRQALASSKGRTQIIDRVIDGEQEKETRVLAFLRVR